MDVAILSVRRGWHTAELERALGARGHRARVLPFDGLRAGIGNSPQLSAGGVPLDGVDAVLVRIIPRGSLEQIIFRVDALHWLEDRGVTVMNSPRAIERAVDKFYTTVRLREAGLPTPDTVVCEGLSDAMAAVDGMLAEGSDVIVKPLFGSMGHGLVRVGDRELAWRVLRSLGQTRPVFYLQRAVDHGGRDIRAFVVGGRVLAAIERLAPAGEWRTNVAVGGEARACSLSPECEELAVRAADAVGADYAGVDLIQSRTGEQFVLEVNAIPGWQGLQRATGVDVAATIVDHLVATAGRREARERSTRSLP